VTGLALSGWLAAGVTLLLARRRLELVTRAEHELRGPITALALGLEAAACAEGAARGPRLDALEGQLDRLRIGLADLTRARRGRRASPQVQRVLIERVVRAAALGWEPAARRVGGSMAVDWRAGQPVVEADPARLSQAIGNLLSNAVEHGGGDVEVRGDRAPATVRLEVRSSGPAFGSGGPPDRRQGRGRGLAIATRAVEEAGGTLRVAPSSGGAVVALELPVAEHVP